MLPRPTTAYPTRFVDAIVQFPFSYVSFSALFFCKHTVGSAFAIGAAKPLIFNCPMIKSAEFFDVLEYFLDAIDDAVDIFLATKEEMMREPNRLVIGGTLGGRALVHVPQIERRRASPAQRRIVGWVERE